MPFGGPDGGDGGKGGDVVFLADSNMDDLGYFKHQSIFKAENGGRGGPNQKHGLNGQNMVVKVPAGTSIYVKEGIGELLTADLQEHGQKIIVAKGGRGGRGNIHFATATRKTPRIFQPGEEGECYDIILRMWLPIDVCIVGYSNSGKSTLITALSAARPAIAEYSFTTTEPVLGTVDDGIRNYLWAEMPSLTGGSSGIKGPGVRYLSQTHKASVILYLMDASSGNLEDDWRNLKSMLSESVPEINQKASVVAVNKIDLVQYRKQIDSLKEQLAPGCPVCYISAREKTGLGELVACVHSLIEKVKQEQEEVIQPLKIFRPKPVDKDN